MERNSAHSPQRFEDFPNPRLLLMVPLISNPSSAGFTTGPVGPGPRAQDPGGPQKAKKKKKKRKKEKGKKEESKLDH